MVKLPSAGKAGTVQIDGGESMVADDPSWYRDLTDCTVLKASKSKRLLRRGPADSSAARLIKIYLYPGPWQRLKFFFRKSKAEREMALAGRVSRAGIPTLVPRRIKDVRRWGFLRQSMVLTPFLPDCLNLEELLLIRRVPDRRHRREVLREYGRLARLIHDQGLYQDDFDPNNILYQPLSGTAFRLYLVDFERARLGKRLSYKKRVYLLAKLNRMGRRLKPTDQLRFLAAYLGPATDRARRKEWLTAIKVEEEKVRVRDQRRARRQCTVAGRRIGFFAADGWRGYYRKRAPSGRTFCPSDIRRLLRAVEISMAAAGQCLPDGFNELAVSTEKGTERFRARFFEYRGWRFRLPGAGKRTPLMKAWLEDNGELKNRSADFLPVAAMARRVAGHRFVGVLVRQAGQDPNYP